MKAAMLYGVKDLRIEIIEVPEVGAGEVLVRVKVATTCGTDLKIFQRGYVEKVIKLPTVFGHEWAGEVVEVGEGLEWPRKNMRVRAGNSAPCLHCTMCRKGKYNLCENMIWLWGAYAEYIKVPARMVLVNMQEIPQHVSYEEAAITEPLACVLHGAEKANIRLGDTVTIIGAGPIGLLHLLTAKKNGAGKIISIDLVEERLNFAKKLGADETINAGKENVVETVLQLTGGYGADVVIEAKLDTELLHYGEVTVLGTFHATPLHFREALSLISSRTLDVRPLVTRRMRLEDIKEAFEILSTSKTEIKIAINP